VIIGVAVIIICITALSCVPPFLIYRAGFRDMPFIFQQAFAFLAVVVVEGVFARAGRRITFSSENHSRKKRYCPKCPGINHAAGDDGRSNTRAGDPDAQHEQMPDMRELDHWQYMPDMLM
jgi:hypothetical protein